MEQDQLGDMMKRNNVTDILFYGFIMFSLVFVFDQAFAVQQAAESNPQLMFQYSNKTEPMQNSMTVFTDSSSYVDGEFMTISGNVGSVTGLKFTEVEIFNPSGTLIHVEQIPVGGGGSYHTSFIVGGVLWNKIGIYTIKSYYESNNLPSETTFYFGGKVSKQSVDGELTINNVKLMRATGITTLYDEINGLNETYFVSGYENNKEILLNTTKSVNQSVLNGEYYGTFVGLSKIETIADETLTEEGKAKIIPLVNDLKVSLQIATSPEFPAFVPLVLGVMMMIIVSYFKNRYS